MFGVNNQASGNDVGNNVTGRDNIAMGANSGNAVTGGNNIAIGTGAGNNVQANNTIAIGTNAQVAEEWSTAIGTGTVVQLAGGVAIGTDGTGQGATTTTGWYNHIVLGTGLHTYTLTGIASAESRARQSGPLELVTSDAFGNLATDGGIIFDRLDDHTSGIALAMAMENPDLTGDETFGFSGNYGTFQGAHALALSAMGVVGYDIFDEGDRVAISGAIGIGLPTGTNGNGVYGARVGLQVTR